MTCLCTSYTYYLHNFIMYILYYFHLQKNERKLIWMKYITDMYSQFHLLSFCCLSIIHIHIQGCYKNKDASLYECLAKIETAHVNCWVTVASKKALVPRSVLCPVIHLFQITVGPESMGMLCALNEMKWYNPNATARFSC